MGKSSGSFGRYKKAVVSRCAEVKAEQGRVSPEIKDTSAAVKKYIVALIRKGDLDGILTAEKFHLQTERTILANVAEMKSSLDSAIMQIEAAIAVAKIACDSERYKILADGYTTPKNTIGGVPRDEARQFFKAHAMRSKNRQTAPAGIDEREIQNLRNSALKAAENFYVSRQKKALGITYGRDRGPSDHEHS